MAIRGERKWTLSAGGMVGQPTLVMLRYAQHLECDVSQDTFRFSLR